MFLFFILKNKKKIKIYRKFTILTKTLMDFYILLIMKIQVLEIEN